MTDKYREKFVAFLEATGQFKDIEKLVEEDVVKAHDMGLYVNEIISVSKETIEELSSFKDCVLGLIQMFSFSLIKELLVNLNGDANEQP